MGERPVIFRICKRGSRWSVYNRVGTQRPPFTTDAWYGYGWATDFEGAVAIVRKGLSLRGLS